MDENAISVMCSVNGCFWRVVGDERCPQHGGFPQYAWEPSEWGDDREFCSAADNEPPNVQPTVLEGATK